jgi:membrane-associated protease RseP (regulator of RpoE activity)
VKRIKKFFQILTALLVLEAAFVVHEYGHLQEFQKHGVPVEEFSLGIGPRLYEYQTASSFVVTIRLLPIMAYVKPTEEGYDTFTKEVSLKDQLVVHVAGVRNNFVTGLVLVFALQVAGWTRGNLPARSLAATMLMTPLNMLLRFFALLIGLVTLGRINLAPRFLLSTGDIVPPKPLRSFIVWNLSLGLFNLVPVPPLDGGHAFQAVLTSTGLDACIPEISTLMGALFFMAFYINASRQDLRTLEIEPPFDED